MYTVVCIRRVYGDNGTKRTVREDGVRIVKVSTTGNHYITEKNLMSSMCCHRLLTKRPKSLPSSLRILRVWKAFSCQFVKTHFSNHTSLRVPFTLFSSLILSSRAFAMSLGSVSSYPVGDTCSNFKSSTRSAILPMRLRPGVVGFFCAIVQTVQLTRHSLRVALITFRKSSTTDF